LTPYGVFVELKEGVGGMVHISDLSWTKRYTHPSEFTKVGDEIETVILEVDKESRKLSLGHKQLEENPWDTFENVFPMGSYHEATVIKKEDRGAIVQLPYGLEAFAPIKHIKKEDGNLAEVDEKLTVKVIEFNRDDKRIIVSHLRYLDDINREAEGEVKREVEKQRKQTRATIKKTNSKVEGTTLGDLGVFSELKDAFNEPAPKKAAPKAKEKSEEKKEEAAAEAAAEKKPAKAAAKKSAKGDDFKKIEGIGPKTAEHLANAGLTSFKELSEASVDQLKEILEAAGPRYKIHDPTTWPEQAAIAADGDWDKLKELQDKLNGGKA